MKVAYRPARTNSQITQKAMSMRERTAIPALTILFLLMSAWPAGACGDKLLILGRGVRYEVSPADYPARILLYVNPALLGSEPYKEVQLQSVVDKANHSLKSVKSREDLAAELKTPRYDIVLVSFADAAVVEEMVRTSPSRPIVLPWVDKKNRVEKSRAEKQYHFFLTPGSVQHFLSTVDRAMERREKLVRNVSKGGASQVSLLR